MENKVRKPMSVARRELADGIANLINNAGVPPFVVEPILADLLKQVKDAAEQEYQDDYRAYSQALAESMRTDEARDE